MTRLASALRLEITLQNRQKFLHAAIFSGLIWLAVLLPMPHGLRPVAEPYVLPGGLVFCMLGPSDPLPRGSGDLVLQKELAYRLPFSGAERRLGIFRRTP